MLYMLYKHLFHLLWITHPGYSLSFLWPNLQYSSFPNFGLQSQKLTKTTYFVHTLASSHLFYFPCHPHGGPWALQFYSQSFQTFGGGLILLCWYFVFSLMYLWCAAWYLLQWIYTPADWMQSLRLRLAV